MSTPRFKVEVTWGDCDPAGIVFYPRYFAWFDAATHALLSSIGLDHTTLTTRFNAVGLSLVDAQASFRAPSTFGDKIEVKSRITKIGGSSVRVEHVIMRDDIVLVEGYEVRVWIVREAGAIRGAPIPPPVRAKLNAMGEDSVP